MKTKDLALGTVYAHREPGGGAKVVALDVSTNWTSAWYGNTPRYSATGGRARRSPGGNNTTGLLVLKAFTPRYGEEPVSDEALLAAAEAVDLDEVGADAKAVNDALPERVRLAVVLPVSVIGPWTEFVAERERQAEADRQRWSEERKAQEAMAQRRAEMKVLAEKLGVPVRANEWDSVASLSFKDMIALLERLAAAEKSEA